MIPGAMDPRLASVATPALVYDLTKLRKTAARLQALCVPFHGQCCYSVKANRHPRILAELADAGFGADVASDAELECAISAGLTPIVATSPGLSTEAIQKIDQLGGIVFFDHIEQVRAAVGSRLALQHHGIRIALPGDYNGFGFDVPAESDRLSAEFNFRPRRLHVHGGEIGTCAGLIQRLCVIEGYVRQFKTTEVNLGGGWGVLSNNGVELAEAFDHLARFSVRLGIRLIFEFGKIAVARCGSLVTQVIAVKRRSDLQIIVVDVSSFNLGTLERRQLWGTTSTSERRIRTRVMGPSCYEGDLFGVYQDAPALQVGDRILFAPLGAYSISIASNLHGLPPPREIVWEEGHTFVTRHSN
jgi:diaminopimelate decarboxylase